MAKQVSAEFVALFEQHHSQIANGHVMNETFVHFADKLLAMLKDDFKKLYELEKKEHEELLAETRPKTIWPAGGGAGGGAALCSTACGDGLGLTACRCGANRGSDCDCWEDFFREENDVGGATAPAAKPPVLERVEPQVANCELHGPMENNNGGGPGLCHTANSRGYSMYSPPCNGCRMGKQDLEKGLWMSGFAGKSNVLISTRPDFQEPLHTPPHSPIERVCPGAPLRPAAADIWGASAPMSPIDQIPDDHF
jgi:hypothetical protein